MKELGKEEGGRFRDGLFSCMCFVRCFIAFYDPVVLLPFVRSVSIVRSSSTKLENKGILNFRRTPPQLVAHSRHSSQRSKEVGTKQSNVTQIRKEQKINNKGN